MIPPKVLKKAPHNEKLGKWKNEKLNLCGQRQVLQSINSMRRGEFDRYKDRWSQTMEAMNLDIHS